MLRLPDSMPVEEKKQRVDSIIDALDMRKCLKTSKRYVIVLRRESVYFGHITDSLLDQ